MPRSVWPGQKAQGKRSEEPWKAVLITPLAGRKWRPQSRSRRWCGARVCSSQSHGVLFLDALAASFFGAVRVFPSCCQTCLLASTCTSLWCLRRQMLCWGKPAFLCICQVWKNVSGPPFLDPTRWNPRSTQSKCQPSALTSALLLTPRAANKTSKYTWEITCTRRSTHVFFCVR